MLAAVTLRQKGDQAAHPAEFPHGIEVTHKGHPRIDTLAILLVK